MDPTSGLDNDSAASASFGAASSRLSRTRKAHPGDDQSTMVPAVASRNHQAIAQRGYMSKFYVEVDAQSQTGQVSLCCCITYVLTNDLMTLRYSLPLMQPTHELLSRSPYLPLSPLIYLLRKKPEPP